jgi:uncharacterized protein YaaW (UPF0174 family)
MTNLSLIYHYKLQTYDSGVASIFHMPTKVARELSIDFERHFGAKLQATSYTCDPIEMQYLHARWSKLSGGGIELLAEENLLASATY